MADSFRLKDGHPIHVKFTKLCNFAEDLGISIYVDRYGTMHITDNEFPGIEFQVVDIDARLGDMGTAPEIPPNVEVKIVFEGKESEWEAICRKHKTAKK